MDSRLRQLEKLGAKSIVGFGIRLLYIAQFLQGIENPMHCGSGEGKVGREFLKGDRLLLGTLVDKILQDGENLGCNADVIFVYLARFGCFGRFAWQRHSVFDSGFGSVCILNETKSQEILRK
jgi:hypothetical protein